MRIDSNKLPEKGNSRKSRRQRRRILAEHRDARRRRERLNKLHDERELQKKVRRRLNDSRNTHHAEVEKQILYYLDGKVYYRPRMDVLANVLLERAPRLFIEPNGLILSRVIRQSWIRPLDDWVPLGRGRRSQLRSLVDHLIVRYPVPAFISRAFFDPDTRDVRACKVAPLFAHIARGGSIRQCVETSIISLPMTRRMCHLFMQSPANMPPLLALICAMVQGHGGDQALAQAIHQARVFEKRGPKVFWSDVIHWFCRQTDLDLVQVGPMIDYIESRYRRDNTFEMKGRTVKAMIRGMEAWHRDLNLEKRLHGVKFKRSGLSARAWTVKASGNNGAKSKDEWTMSEILCSKDLVREGRAMGHCVASYADSISSGRCAIWSLKFNNSRCLTVEVGMSDKEVVQARGKYNRPAKGRERALLGKWAKANQLKVGDLSGGW